MANDFMTDPLVGLLPKSLDEMTDEELQSFVTNVRSLRTSSQMLKAEMNQSVEKVKVGVSAKAKIKTNEKASTNLLNNMLADL